MTTDIKILDPIEHIRTRPGMFIGATDHPEILLKELVDNALDELLNSYATRVEIINDVKDQVFRVRDNGRGMPIQQKEHKGEVGVATKFLFKELFSSGKFDKSNYKVSSGTNGVGLTACAALSDKVVVRVADKKNVCEGKMYILTLSRGHVVSEEFVDPATQPDMDGWSTEVSIWPDLSIFRDFKCEPRRVQLALAARMFPESEIIYNGKQIESASVETLVDKDLFNDKSFEVKVQFSTITLDILIGHSRSEFDRITKGAVNLGTVNRGIHINHCLNRFAETFQESFPELLSQTAHGFDGVRLFVSAQIGEPGYTSQVKENLCAWDDFKVHNLAASDQYREITLPDGKIDRIKIPVPKDNPSYIEEGMLFDRIKDAYKKIIKQNFEHFEAVAKRINEHRRLTEKLTQQQFIDSVVKTGAAARSKGAQGVTDCTTRNRKEAELYIVEGKSAGGGIVATRDKSTQAVMPLRGKLLNVARVDDVVAVLNNEEIVNMVNAVGVGIRPKVNLEHARYGKIIISTDADPDGMHIRALLISAFTFFCPELIVAGLLYIAEAPLYAQGGKFIHDERDLDPNKKFDRYKGLGSMDPEELYEAIVKPTTRVLRRVTMDMAQINEIRDIVTNSARRRQIMIDRGALFGDDSGYVVSSDNNLELDVIKRHVARMCEIVRMENRLAEKNKIDASMAVTQALNKYLSDNEIDISDIAAIENLIDPQSEDPDDERVMKDVSLVLSYF